jgi:phage-related minor tail protein
MGALDFLKGIQGKVIDSATYQLLERNFQMQADNNQLLAEKASLLQQAADSQKQRIADLEDENSRLRQQLNALKTNEEFQIYKGMAFKKMPNGKTSEQPYCPNCHCVMGVVEDSIVSCSKCKHALTLDNEKLQDIAKRLDENAE